MHCELHRVKKPSNNNPTSASPHQREGTEIQREKMIMLIMRHYSHKDSNIQTERKENRDGFVRLIDSEDEGRRGGHVMRRHVSVPLMDHGFM